MKETRKKTIASDQLRDSVLQELKENLAAPPLVRGLAPSICKQFLKLVTRSNLKNKVVSNNSFKSTYQLYWQLMLKRISNNNLKRHQNNNLIRNLLLVPAKRICILYSRITMKYCHTLLNIASLLTQLLNLSRKFLYKQIISPPPRRHQ